MIFEVSYLSYLRHAKKIFFKKSIISSLMILRTKLSYVVSLLCPKNTILK